MTRGQTVGHSSSLIDFTGLGTSECPSVTITTQLLPTFGNCQLESADEPSIELSEGHHMLAIERSACSFMLGHMPVPLLLSPSSACPDFRALITWYNRQLTASLASDGAM